MATMNISLTDDLKAFIDQQVAENSFMSSSEYIRALLRQEHQKAQVREMILKGGRSPVVAVADEAYFEGKRARVRKATPRRAAG